MKREDTFFKGSETWNLGGKLYPPEWPLVMGIINLTPDSFYTGSRHAGTDECLRTAEMHLQQGAHLLDLGAVSTRPGAQPVSVDEEKERLLPCVEALAKHFPQALVSVDTCRATVARAAVEAGAVMVNDVTAGEADPAMFDTVAQLGAAYVMMHMRGNPQNMQQLTRYEYFPQDIVAYLANRVSLAHRAGVKDIVIDPGVGFAKTAEQNFMLIHSLKQFEMLGKPILMGISRKSFIYKTIGLEATEALNGTTALHMACLMNGAHILRVHDVKEAIQVRNLYLQLSEAGNTR